MPTPPQTDRPDGLRVAVPRDAEELLSPEWLTAALRTRFPDITVTAVHPGPVVSRLSTNIRFRVEYTGDVPEDFTPYLCAKGYFGEVGWLARRAGEHEVVFYRDLAARAGVRTLRGVYADIDPETHANVIITEDVIAQGGTFLDGIEDYTPDQAAESLEQLAVMHAAMWQDPAIAADDSLASRLDTHLMARGLKEISKNFDSELGAVVPEQARDAQRLVDAYRALATAAKTAAPWTLLHGDTHLGNVFLDGAGRPSFTDWQLAQRGPWYLDVGYHIAATISVADRRRTERDLLRHYLDRLRAGGVDAPAFDQAWLDIRQGMVHGFFLWGITLLVKPATIAARLERLGTAVADHDAFTSVEA
ncbi:phosphotransferase [Frankia sp. CNm7]|uniref:Phosphotransferase n=1 Tax=Frankia nepalensis TaxID=1836974 RepID=A0A937RPM5_9ACTN|nr:phosphotransferase [Frankia nepalensis]MBL7501159.1 phosphotransferase [Frankia nepalensis]MBL7512639.1 phosphotransferase [Frankia nepalensis]MBL7518592.1 phosphotransferase [Frankia nepalensis]MBL7632695.1 phosphotransferase [Frankia nepalensis]